MEELRIVIIGVGPAAEGRQHDVDAAADLRVVHQPGQRVADVAGADLPGAVHHPHGQDLRVGCRHADEPGDEGGMTQVAAVERGIVRGQLRGGPAVRLRGIDDEILGAGNIRQPAVRPHPTVQQRDHGTDHRRQRPLEP